MIGQDYYENGQYDFPHVEGMGRYCGIKLEEEWKRIPGRRGRKSDLDDPTTQKKYLHRKRRQFNDKVRQLLLYEGAALVED